MGTDPLNRLLNQLDGSQWWSAEKLQQYQFGKLAGILQHAAQHVPHYRDVLEQSNANPSQIATPDHWHRLPVLTRYDIQEAGSRLYSPVLPPGHEPVIRQLTSGSTATPVESLATAATGLFWRAMTIREHQWHNRDYSAQLASIRQTSEGIAEPPNGMLLDNWGSATQGHVDTGPAQVLSIFSTTAEQADWLQRTNPQYLMTYPSALLALAEHFQQHGGEVSNLQEVRTFGEVLDDRVRRACHDVWNVPVIDNYSSQETGYIALQCPDNEHYHIAAEDLLVEVLDDDDNPCRSGETGRVVVSTLHNYAMPLLRYEIGDYAQVGGPCSCGRGLPVLRRILGRSRNMFVLPDGSRVWPTLEASDNPELSDWPVRQYQVVQRDRNHIDAYLVALRKLTSDEEALAIREFHKAVRHPFPVTFHYVDSIARGPSGKYEEFRSCVQ